MVRPHWPGLGFNRRYRLLMVAPGVATPAHTPVVVSVRPVVGVPLDSAALVSVVVREVVPTPLVAPAEHIAPGRAARFLAAQAPVLALVLVLVVRMVLARRVDRYVRMGFPGRVGSTAMAGPVAVRVLVHLVWDHLVVVLVPVHWAVRVLGVLWVSMVLARGMVRVAAPAAALPLMLLVAVLVAREWVVFRWVGHPSALVVIAHGVRRRR